LPGLPAAAQHGYLRHRDVLSDQVFAGDASLRGQTPSSTESMEYETSVRPFAWPSHQPRYEAATLIRRKWSGNREFVFTSGS
jgi:hypothetical protein